jgi:RNA polymerase sigma-70 factor, ECF subfamily
MNYVIQGGSLNDQPVDEAKLLQQAQEGDAEAFGALYERFAPPVHRYLFAHLSNRMDAEDLTEEAFLRVWNRLPEYRDQGVPFVAYLMRVARNVLIDFYRSNNKTILNPIEDDHTNGNHQETATQDPLSSRLERQELREVLNKLREDYRSVLVARFISGLSPEETAQVMGRTAGAVRVLQHRAIGALKKLLEAEQDLDG